MSEKESGSEMTRVEDDNIAFSLLILKSDSFTENIKSRLFWRCGEGQACLFLILLNF